MATLSPAEMCVPSVSVELSWRYARGRAGPGERAHLQGGESLHKCPVELSDFPVLLSTYHHLYRKLERG